MRRFDPSRPSQFSLIFGGSFECPAWTFENYQRTAVTQESAQCHRLAFAFSITCVTTFERAMVCPIFSAGRARK